jgi:hypothetical protein
MYQELLRKSLEVMSNSITHRTEGRLFLRLKHACEMSSIETNTWRRRVYEIDTPSGTEVWIERESKLEAPEYFYDLFQYQGDEEVVTP